MYEKNPLVSVIIPTYNRASLLKRAIKSVLDQTYKNLEIIIVDDGSTDRTEEIVKDFSDKRIRYIHHSKNRGVSAARNRGVKSSKGNFIALLDHDDEYLPERIEKSLKVFKDAPESLGMVWSNFWKVNPVRDVSLNGVNKEKKVAFLKYSLEDVKKWMFPMPLTWTIRKKVFEKIGFFDEELGPAEDTDFAIRLCKNFSFYFIDEPLAIYHITKGSLSSNINIEKLIKIRKIFLEKHLDLKKNRKLIASYLCYIGSDLLRIGQVKEARKCLLKSFITHPIRVKYLTKFLGTYIKKVKRSSNGK